MVCPVTAVYDCLVGYKNIAITQNLAISKRAFTNTLKNILTEGNTDEMSVSDLSLYHVGDFDMETGELIPTEPTVLITGNQIFIQWMNETESEV